MKKLSSFGQVSIALGVVSIYAFFKRSSFITEQIDGGTLTHLQVPWYVAAVAIAGFVVGIASRVAASDITQKQQRTYAYLGVAVSMLGLLLSQMQLNTTRLG